MTYVYMIRARGAGGRGRDAVKIGVSADPVKRMGELQTGCPHELELVAQVPGGTDLENTLHLKFNGLQLHGEWFQYDEEVMLPAFGKEVLAEGAGNQVTLVHALLGMWFYAKNRGGWQGYIAGEVAPGLFLVQLFEWIMGTPTHMELVPITDMVGWSFHPTGEEMTDWYDTYEKHRHDHTEARDRGRVDGATFVLGPDVAP